MNIIKKIIIIVIIVVIGFIIYENFFKDTKYYTVVNGEISKSQIKNALTENEVKEVAIKNLELITSGQYTLKEDVECNQYIKSGEMYWRLESDDYEIRINSINGNLIYYKDKAYMNITDSDVTYDKAKQIVEEIMAENNISDDYKIKVLEKENLDIWELQLCKQENGVFNEYRSIELNFVPETKRIILLEFKDYIYTNNEIKITEEQAKQIAKDVYEEQDISQINIEKCIDLVIDRKINSEINLADEIEITDISNALEYMQRFKETRQIKNVWNVSIINSEGDEAIYQIDMTNRKCN